MDGERYLQRYDIDFSDNIALNFATFSKNNSSLKTSRASFPAKRLTPNS